MAGALRPNPYPTSVEVRAIAAVPDSVVRNLRITECYSRLSAAMAARAGEGANWCTFATWASRQAGSTIRGEDLLARFTGQARQGWTIFHPVQSAWRALLRAGIFNPSTRLGRVVRAVHTPFDAFERASAAVAEGNLKVFEEIALAFAQYLEGTLELREGPPPDGQDLLRRAFDCYREAGALGGEKQAQRILLANLCIGLHEQTRLQPQIQSALEVAPETAEDLTIRLVAALGPGSRLLPILLRPLAFAARRFRRFARLLTRRAITESLMVLQLPGTVLQLGSNLEVPCPEIFQKIADADLVELIRKYEPDSTCDRCGADDWADLNERMHYIIHLFRAFHLRQELWEFPFRPEQVLRLQAGRIPEGNL